MGHVIRRKGLSAADDDIVIVEFHDLIGLIDSHKSLLSILLTGFSGPSSTYHSLMRYLDGAGVDYDLPSAVKPGEIFYIYRGRSGEIRDELGGRRGCNGRKSRETLNERDSRIDRDIRKIKVVIANPTSRRAVRVTVSMLAKQFRLAIDL
jgi:hypothetical protein